MVNRYQINLIKKCKIVCESKGLVFAQTNGPAGYFKSIRVYKNENDKGHPDRALYETFKINLEVLHDLEEL